MARPTLSSHPKFAKLAQRLKSRALARGVLELIWESCYASGEAVVGDADAVEAIADWRGERGELAALLGPAPEGCGFLDVMHADANGGQLHDANGGRLHVVHDLEDHAPDYVLKRWEREAKRRESGLTIRSLRQEAARVRWKQRVMQVSAVVLPPAPAPAPTRSEIDPDANGGQLHRDRRPDLPRMFGRVWSEERGGMEWQGVPGESASRSAAQLLDSIAGDPAMLSDLRGTMALLLRNAAANEYARSAEILKSRAFAFAVWCTEFPALREQLHGVAPASPRPKKSNVTTGSPRIVASTGKFGSSPTGSRKAAL